MGGGPCILAVGPASFCLLSRALWTPKRHWFLFFVYFLFLIYYSVRHRLFQGTLWKQHVRDPLPRLLGPLPHPTRQVHYLPSLPAPTSFSHSPFLSLNRRFSSSPQPRGCVSILLLRPVAVRRVLEVYPFHPLHDRSFRSDDGDDEAEEHGHAWGDEHEAVRCGYI